MQDITPLLEGFRRFQRRFFRPGDNRYEELRKGQKPSALVIACSDSRVDPAILTDCDPGDMFVVRNVANLVPPRESGGDHHGVSAALEYAVSALGVGHVIIIGHSSCGGIHALMAEGGPAGEFIAPWVNIARPAREKILREMPGAAPEAQTRACEMAAILVSMENLRSFPCVRKRCADGSLRLHGWYFDMDAGELLGYSAAGGGFLPLVARDDASR